MKYPHGLAAFVFLSSVISLSESSPRQKDRRDRNYFRDKRQLEEPVDPLIAILTEEASKIPLDRFEDDPYLYQTLDKINDFSVYNSPYKTGKKKSNVVYERSVNDGDKDVVVLNKAEDKLSLKVHNGKQTYVVLRKNPKSIVPAYFAIYAYIRNATDSDYDAIVIEGDRKYLEWDIWEDRTQKKATTWTTCSSTFLLSCGFNETAFTSSDSSGGGTYHIVPPMASEEKAKSEAEAKEAQIKKVAKVAQEEESNNKTKPSVTLDDAEFEIDNYDFYDDLNIDVVHGRTMMAQGRSLGVLGAVTGNVGSTTGAVVTGVGNILCGVVGTVFGGGCGSGGSQQRGTTGRKHTIKKVVITKTAVIQPISVKKPPVDLGPGYIPLGSPTVVPIPPYMNPFSRTPIHGVFYCDDRRIPAAEGDLTPYGSRKPYYFKATKPTFGKTLPADKGTVGIFVPAFKGGSGLGVHGIMLPTGVPTGIFLPDGMAYPGTFTASFGGGPLKGFYIPGFPGFPDEFIPDSDITNPLRKYDRNYPISGTTNPSLPNYSAQPIKTGQMLMNKMPLEFYPNELKGKKATFQDDQKKFAPVAGWFVPGFNGQPDLFIPDDETLGTSLSPMKTGTITPVDGSAVKHGTFVFSPKPGDADRFIPDDAGGMVVFIPNNPASLPSTGLLTPYDAKKENKFYPVGPLYKASVRIPGRMKQNPPGVPPVPDITGDLIVNQPTAPAIFVPTGGLVAGSFQPKEPAGAKAILGAWVPGRLGQPDVFIPDEETDVPTSPTEGTFTKESDPNTKIPMTTNPPLYPGGPLQCKPIPDQYKPAPIPDPPAGAAPEPPPPTPSGPSGQFIPDGPGGPGSPIDVTSNLPNPSPTAPIPVTPKDPSKLSNSGSPRGSLVISPQKPINGKLTPPAYPGAPNIFVPDPEHTVPAKFMPSNPSANSPSEVPGYAGPPPPPTEQIKFTPDNDAQAPQVDTPGTLSIPGQPPIKGLAHPPAFPGGPVIFTPFSPSLFTPTKNPTSPIKGTSPPSAGSSNQLPIAFNPDNPGQVSPGSAPQRGTLTRPGSPVTSGNLVPPASQGDTPQFVPDPANTKPCEVKTDQNPNNPVPGYAMLPYNPSDPITFTPDDKTKLPPGDNKGTISIPGENPPDLHGTVQVPNSAPSSDPSSPSSSSPAFSPPVKFFPDTPAIFTPFNPPNAPVPGFKEDPNSPGDPTKFYPTDPSKLPFSSIPGTLSTPSSTNPADVPINGILSPDTYPNPGYVFITFPQCVFSPDNTKTPNKGGLEPPKTLGQSPNFYPDVPAGLPQQKIPGSLQVPNSPDQHGVLEVSPSGLNGPRPFSPDPVGQFYPDSSPKNGIPVSAQSPADSSSGPTQIRPQNPNSMPVNPSSGPTGTLKVPGKPDQHGTAELPKGPGEPYSFKPDPPGSKPSTFVPLLPPGNKVPGLYNNNPASFKPNDPNALPRQDTPGFLTPNDPPGSPPMTGSLVPGIGAADPWTWQPDPSMTFYPDSNPNIPIQGTGPLPKTPQDNTPFFPNNPSQMGNGNPLGTLKSPGGTPDRRGTLQPNPSPTQTPSWIFKPEPPSNFFPDASPGAPISGSVNQPSTPGGPIPFNPLTPGQVPPGSPKGTLKQPGQPDFRGSLSPPAYPGEPYLIVPLPPSVFYPDNDPYSPIPGQYEQPQSPEQSAAFDPTDPSKIPQSKLPGTLKIPGKQDVHGCLDHGPTPADKPQFSPDPAGSLLVTIYLDRDTNTAVEGVLFPASSPGGPSSFWAVDASKLSLSDEDHGQLIQKSNPTAVPEFGSVSPPKIPGGPFTWTPDGVGVTSAWFYLESRPQQPIRGVYTPPAAGSPPEASGIFKATRKEEAATNDEHGQLQMEKPPNSPQEPGTLKPSGGGANLFFPDPKNVGIPATFYPDIKDINSGGEIEGIYASSSKANEAGTFKANNEGATPSLPCTGQMVAKNPSTPPAHGVLKAGASGGFAFTIDPADGYTAPGDFKS